MCEVCVSCIQLTISCNLTLTQFYKIAPLFDPMPGLPSTQFLHPLIVKSCVISYIFTITTLFSIKYRIQSNVALVSIRLDLKKHLTDPRVLNASINVCYAFILLIKDIRMGVLDVLSVFCSQNYNDKILPNENNFATMKI